MELLLSGFENIFHDFLMRDFEPGLCVLWDDGSVIAIIFLVGKWLPARAEVTWSLRLDGLDFSVLGPGNLSSNKSSKNLMIHRVTVYKMRISYED